MMKLSNKTYDVMKWVAMVLLPAFIVLFKALGGVWNIPLTNEISDTLVAINAFLGAILGVSTASYNKEN